MYISLCSANLWLLPLLLFLAKMLNPKEVCSLCKTSLSQKYLFSFEVGYFFFQVDWFFIQVAYNVFHLGGLLDRGSLHVQLHTKAFDAELEQHADWSHWCQEAPHLFLLLPKPNKVKSIWRAWKDGWFYQVRSSWPPPHAAPGHSQREGLLSNPGKSSPSMRSSLHSAKCTSFSSYFS